MDMEILKTDIFDKWLRKLRDRKAKAIILVHINRLIEDKFGKIRALGDGIYEKKISYGPGYRIYFFNGAKSLVVLLCGGDKSTQKDDIKQAKIIMQTVKEKF